MRTAFLATCLWLICSLANAQAIHEERVHFGEGLSGTTLKGKIKGDEIIDYILGASAGQNMSIDFQATNASAYFNLSPIDSQSAIHIGSTEGDNFDGTLPVSGDYRIRVYLMRNAARRHETANFSLSISVDASAAQAPSKMNPDFADGLTGGPDFWMVRNIAANDTLNVRAGPGTGNKIIGKLANGDRVRNMGCQMADNARWCQIETGADQKFTGWVNGHYLAEASAPSSDGIANSEASGKVPCSTAPGQPTGTCSFRATRGGNGNASVWIALPGGKERYIEFRAGDPITTDATMAVTFEKMADLYLIRMGGKERYEIPEAVIYGG